ncbi:MAG: hypothetical protein ABSE74_04840 [Methanoregula sp.]|jgi:hypothetical protein
MSGHTALPARKQRLFLVIIAFAVFMASLDSTILAAGFRTAFLWGAVLCLACAIISAAIIIRTDDSGTA